MPKLTYKNIEKLLFTIYLNKAENVSPNTEENEKKYLTYLKGLSKSELFWLITELKSIYNNDGFKNLGSDSQDCLFKTAHFNEEEKSALQISKKEKATIAFQMFHVITTSILGFGSAILGFLTLSNPVLAIALAGLCAFSILPAKNLIQTSVGILRKTEKKTIEQATLSKLMLSAQIAMNTKKDKKLSKKLEELDKLTEELLGESFTKDDENFEYLEDAYLHPSGLNILKDKFRHIYNGQPNLENFLEKLKHIRDDESAPALAQSHDKSVLAINISSNQANKPALRPRPTKDTIESSLQTFTFREWFKNNPDSAKQAGMSNGFGTIAGSMVFPAFLMALAATNVAAVKLLGLTVFVGAMTGPIGIGITIGVILLVGLSVVGLSLFSKYRNDKRNFVLQKLKKHEEYEADKGSEYQLEEGQTRDLIDAMREFRDSMTPLKSPEPSPVSQTLQSVPYKFLGKKPTSNTKQKNSPPATNTSVTSENATSTTANEDFIPRIRSNSF